MYRLAIFWAAFILCAGGFFTILMSFTTTGHESTAWATATGIIAVPGLFLGIVWTLTTPRRTR
jgi:hypothetical protein